MNIEQLERIKTMITSIVAELETETTGTLIIDEKVEELLSAVNKELKNKVWTRYLGKG